MLPTHDPRIQARSITPRITWHVVMATPAGRVNAATSALVTLVTEAKADQDI
jgi:hypothetical protein